MEIILSTLNWIKEDYKSNWVRFCGEVIAWALSITCSIMMAITVPNPPLLPMYIMWVTGCGLYACAAYSRKSFGMLANYIALFSIDSYALSKLVLI